MPLPLARQAAGDYLAGSRCDRRAPQGIGYDSSSLSLPTTWPVESDSGAVRFENGPRSLDFVGFVWPPLSVNTDTYCKWKLHRPVDGSLPKTPCPLGSHCPPVRV